MRLAMSDGSTLMFDSIKLEDDTIVAVRTGFPGTAIGVNVGGHIFPFREPYSFGIPSKQTGGIAGLLAQGDEFDTFIVHFNLGTGLV